MREQLTALFSYCSGFNMLLVVELVVASATTAQCLPPEERCQYRHSSITNAMPLINKSWTFGTDWITSRR